ncbi:MAG: LptE family protein [Candidatus Aminicenantes bacterium]|nr:LptE family protein [Candidatus Aminicenantes bacterium]
MIMKASSALVLLTAALAVFSSSCGYTTSGSGLFLVNNNITTVFIPLFKNNTTRFELDLKLTEAVIREFVTRGKVKIVQDAASADAVLDGVVTGFSASPIAYSGAAQGSADRFAITISASITLRDQRTKEEMFANPSYVYKGEYQVPQGTDFESQETEKLGEIAQLFARNLVMTILEGF